MKNPKKCFAIDYSGSTNGEIFYHKNVKEILDKKYNNKDDIIIWDSSSKFISYNEYMKINKNKEGNGGTSPESIFKLFKNKKKKKYSEFILITDGQVGQQEVELCDKNFELYKNNFNYDYCEVYLIGNKGSTNLSVSCPFTRFCPSKTILKSPQEEKIISEISNDDLKIIDKINSISTLNEFNQYYDSLKKAFIVRLIGTSGDIELRKSVLLMQKRIIQNNTDENKSLNEEKIDILLKEKKFEEAKNELSNCFQIIQNEFSQKINLLIRMSDGAIKQIFDIDQIQSFQVLTSSNTEEVDTLQLEDIPSSIEHSKFICPISIENEIDPVILITVPEEFINNNKIIPLLVGFDKLQTENIISCPYNALYNKDFMDKFIKCIDHAISLKQIRDAELSGHPFEVSPITRKKIIGIIPLGESIEHIKAADWTLMQLISGGKNLGDRNIWFSILWLLVKEKKFPYLNDVEDFLKAQVIYRFTNFKTSISMSGLGNLPQKKVYYGTAAWACLMSIYLIPKISRNCNLLLVHLFHYKELIEIVNLFQYKLPDNYNKIVNMILCLASLMSFFKKNSKLLPFYIYGISHNTILINVPEDSPMKNGGLVGELFLPIDGEINEKNREKCLKKLPQNIQNIIKGNIISYDELAYVMKFINIQKNLSDIEFEKLIEIKDNYKCEIFNIWENYFEEKSIYPVNICPKTMRPYYNIKDETWKDCLSKKIDISKPFLSLNCDYGKFVSQYLKYPTLDEFILYSFRRYILNSKFNTLPSYISLICQSVLDDFSPVIKDIKPELFKQIFNDSAPIQTRIKLEKNEN
jgi:hypothetical protein